MSITWCSLSTSSSAMERPTAPAPAIATRTGHPSCGGAAAAAVTSLTVARHRRHVDGVLVLHHGLGSGQHAVAEPRR